MEEDQEQGHACKLCKKHFPCGRSLGGHMRSHIRSSNTSTTTTTTATATTTEKKEKLEKKAASSDINGGSSSNNNTYLVDFEAGGHVGYGLRENPKKTWRLSDSIDGSFKYCKECGKGFQSSKALFGHMKSHSEKDLEDGNHKLIMDSQSETETKAPKRGRRSRRSRYKNTTTVTVTATASSSFANASSSVSEIEQEQEEVAMCLMMLSRDVGYWGGLNSVGESWDTNSVVVEVRSSSVVKMNSHNVDHSVKVKKLRDKKLNCVQLELNGGNSSFGGLRNGFKKLESAVSVDRSTEECKFKKPKCNEEDGFEVSNAELGKYPIEEAEYQTDSECGKYNSGKRSRCSRESSNPKMLEASSLKKLKCDTMESPNTYECTACSKTFHSYQALGGHRASHKKAKGCFTARTDQSCETSMEITASPDSKNDIKLIKPCSTESPIQREGTSRLSLKKNKHECPICFKVFASGQALGGHKRCHALESSEARGSQKVIVQQQLPVIRDLLDLNLPAPVEEETNGGTGVKPWWFGNNHKHEQAVGLN